MNLLDNKRGRAVLFTSLYASEGAPIGFIWWAMPTLLRSRQVAVDRITALTAMLVLPWVFKFVWAPLVDSLRNERWGFRSWIICAQLLMGASLVPLMWLDPLTNFAPMSGLLLAHAFLGATQDVAIDALAVNIVPGDERGAINGQMQAGMLLGRSLFGGGAVLAANQLGWKWVFVGLISVIWFSLALMVIVKEPPELQRSRPGFTSFSLHLKRALRRKATWVGIAFALISASAFESTGALAGPYLIDRHLSADTVGWFFAAPVVFAMIAGVLIGGRLSDRWGRALSVGIFLSGFVLSILLLGVLDRRVPAAVLLAVITAMYLFIGLFTAASYALFMDLTDPRIGGTQFSTFMAATNGCEAWSSWAGGQLVARAGYATSFFAMSAVSLLSLPVLRLLGGERQNFIQQPQED